MSEAELRERAYRQIAEGEALEKLSNGLIVIRRLKHEWNPRFAQASEAELKKLTDKIRGSKFLPEWTLTRYVQWIEQRVAELGWTKANSPSDHTFEEGESVGYSKGKIVTKIRIELSSRCIHAYPVEE